MIEIEYNGLCYNKKHYIYMTINLENFKIYIGYHYGYVDDKYLGSGAILKKLKKSKVSLSKVILEIVSEENWSDREMFWIDHYKSMNPNIGYNLMEGGQRGPRCPGELNGMYGRTHTQEVKDKLSRDTKQRYINEPERLEIISRQHKGKKLSPREIERRREIMMGNIPKNRKKCEFEGVVYDSITALAKHLGITKQSLTHRIKTNKYGIKLL